MLDRKHFLPPLAEQGWQKIIVTTTTTHQKNIISCTSYTVQKNAFWPPEFETRFSLPPPESVLHHHPLLHRTLCRTLDMRNDNEMKCPHHIDQTSFQRLVSVSFLPPIKPADSDRPFPGWYWEFPCGPSDRPNRPWGGFLCSSRFSISFPVVDFSYVYAWLPKHINSICSNVKHKYFLRTLINLQPPYPAAVTPGHLITSHSGQSQGNLALLFFAALLFHFPWPFLWVRRKPRLRIEISRW